VKNQNNNFYLGLDQGSGSTKALLIDSNGKEIFSDSIPVKTIQVNIGQTIGVAEQDGVELFDSILELTHRAKQYAAKNNGVINSIGLSLQRSAVLAWSKDGTPISKVITWRDARVKDDIVNLKSEAETIYQETGLPLTYHYAAAKIALLQKIYPNVNGETFIGTLDTYFTYRISEGKLFITEESHASRSQLYSLQKRSWSKNLCKIFSVDIDRLPKIIPSFSEVGEQVGKLQGIDVLSIMGDQQAAFFGVNDRNNPVLNIGTVASLISLQGGQEEDQEGDPAKITDGYLTGVSWSQGQNIEYQIEASINASGVTVDYLKEKHGLINGVNDINEILSSYLPTDNAAVAFFTYPDKVSSGSPYWRNDLSNIYDKEPQNKIENVAALIENLAFWICYNFEQLKDRGSIPKNASFLTVAGGGSELQYLLRCITSVLKIPIRKVRNFQGSGYGAALVALIAYREINRENSLEKESLNDIKSKLKLDLQYDEIAMQINAQIKNISERYIIWKAMMQKALNN